MTFLHNKIKNESFFYIQIQYYNILYTGGLRGAVAPLLIRRSNQKVQILQKCDYRRNWVVVRGYQC